MSFRLTVYVWVRRVFTCSPLSWLWSGLWRIILVMSLLVPETWPVEPSDRNQGKLTCKHLISLVLVQDTVVRLCTDDQKLQPLREFYMSTTSRNMESLSFEQVTAQVLNDGLHYYSGWGGTLQNKSSSLKYQCPAPFTVNEKWIHRWKYVNDCV